MPAHARSRNPIPLRAALTVLVVAAIAGLYLPYAWLWGVNHGVWVSWPALTLAGAAALGLIWTPAGDVFGRWWIDRVVGILIECRPTAYGVVPVLGMVAGWLLRDRTHLLGDGAMFGEFVARGDLFHGFDLMAFHLPARLYQGFGLSGEPAALQLFAAVSIVSGGLYLAAASWAARAVGREPGERALLHVLLAVSPVWMLFCGYVEAYSLLAVFLLVFMVQLVRYVDGPAPFNRVALAWSCAFFWHLNALLLWPLLPLAAWLKHRENRGLPWRNWALSLAAPAITLLVVAAIYATTGLGRSILASARPVIQHDHGILVGWSGRHGLVSIFHLKDVANLLLLLAPLPLALLATGAARATIRTGRAGVLFLTGAVLWAALAGVLHFKLGPVRDWDLLAPHAAVAALAAFHVFRDGAGDPVAAVGRLLPVGLVLVIPWLLINAGPERAMARLEAVTADQGAHARGLVLENLARRRRLAGRRDEARRLYRLAAEACPANPRFPALYATFLANENDLDGARTAFGRALAADSTYAVALIHAARLSVMQRDFKESLRLARRLAGRPEENADAALIHAAAAEAEGLWPEAAEAYRRARALDPRRADIDERLAGTLLLAGDFSGSVPVFREVLTRAPDNLRAKVGLANAHWQIYRQQPANGDPDLPDTVARLLDEVLAAVAADTTAVRDLPTGLDDLRTWRESVAAAGSNN